MDFSADSDFSDAAAGPDQKSWLTKKRHYPKIFNGILLVIFNPIKSNTSRPLYS